MADTPSTEQANTEIEYPCQFTIRVTGHGEQKFIDTVGAILQNYDAEFNADNLKVKQSRNGKYQSISATVMINDKANFDAMYHDLTDSEYVIWAL